MNTPTERLTITPFLQAHDLLSDALVIARSDLEKSGAIQHFKCCYELSWKFLRRVLASRGIEVNSPREIFRAAAQEKLIDNPETWFEFIGMRNQTVHTYNKVLAEEIFASLPAFKVELDKLKSVLLAL